MFKLQKVKNTTNIQNIRSTAGGWNCSRCTICGSQRNKTELFVSIKYVLVIHMVCNTETCLTVLFSITEALILLIKFISVKLKSEVSFRVAHHRDMIQ